MKGCKMKSGNFLEETEYCNFSHPIVKGLAIEITKNCNTDREKAVALFYWVRNNIQYTFGAWGIKASQVVLQKKGMCTNKAVLLTTLLRACNIPAGFGMLKVDAKEYFGPIIPPMFKDFLGKNSVHFYSYVCLDNKWIKIDSSVDPNLSEKTHYFNPTTQLTEWDGYLDATENLDESHIKSEHGPWANINDLLKKKPKNAKKIVTFSGNIYLFFLRQTEIKIQDTDRELESLFKKWLRKNNFLFYCIMMLFAKYKNWEIKRTKKN